MLNILNDIHLSVTSGIDDAKNIDIKLDIVGIIVKPLDYVANIEQDI